MMAASPARDALSPEHRTLRLAQSSDDSDDDDAVNTSNARVFFGPIHSPEAKFAHLQTPAPIRTRQLLTGQPRSLVALIYWHVAHTL